MFTFASLPIDITTLILSFLYGRDLLRLEGTERFFYLLMQGKRFWLQKIEEIPFAVMKRKVVVMMTPYTIRIKPYFYHGVDDLIITASDEIEVRAFLLALSAYRMYHSVKRHDFSIEITLPSGQTISRNESLGLVTGYNIGKSPESNWIEIKTGWMKTPILYIGSKKGRPVPSMELIQDYVDIIRRHLNSSD